MLKDSYLKNYFAEEIDDRVAEVVYNSMSKDDLLNFFDRLSIQMKSSQNISPKIVLSKNILNEAFILDDRLYVSASQYVEYNSNMDYMFLYDTITGKNISVSSGSIRTIISNEVISDELKLSLVLTDIMQVLSKVIDNVYDYVYININVMSDYVKQIFNVCQNIIVFKPLTNFISNPVCSEYEISSNSYLCTNDTYVQFNEFNNTLTIKVNDKENTIDFSLFGLSLRNTNSEEYVILGSKIVTYLLFSLYLKVSSNTTIMYAYTPNKDNLQNPYNRFSSIVDLLTYIVSRQKYLNVTYLNNYSNTEDKTSILKYFKVLSYNKDNIYTVNGIPELLYDNIDICKELNKILLTDESKNYIVNRSYFIKKNKTYELSNGTLCLHIYKPCEVLNSNIVHCLVTIVNDDNNIGNIIYSCMYDKQETDIISECYNTNLINDLNISEDDIIEFVDSYFSEE